MTAFFESNRFRRPSQMRDRWYVPGLVLFVVLVCSSIFVSVRMKSVPASSWGGYVRWKIILGDAVFLPVLMIALGRYRLGRQFEQRDAALYEVEQGLRRKTHGLEQTIRERTAELREEIEERRRADLLNRGRNRVLEMLAKNESLQATVKVLVTTVTEQRSIWCAGLHQLEGDALLLRGSVGVPEMLMDHLQRIKADFVDAPEAAALQQSGTYTIEDTTQQRTPWRQLLAANGICSAWSVPFFTPAGEAVGVMTIYSRLRAMPTPRDLELLDMVCSMAALVFEHQRLHQQLLLYAYHDVLTGLPNRRLGEERLEIAITQARRESSQVAVLWIDLDQFKHINDTHGHPLGDMVLQQTAARLSKRLRSTDTVARMGGDEFMVILSGVQDRESAEQTAAELHQIVTQPLTFGRVALNIAISIGISVFPVDGETAEQLKQNADTAMYQAKNEHVGTRSFSPVIGLGAAELRDLKEELTRALHGEGYEIDYQPQCKPDGTIVGLEALLRFRHPRLGVVPPSRFIPIAEEMGLIIPLGAWVLERVCRQSVEWQGMGLAPLPIAVNISSLQFARKDFAESVGAILEKTGLDPKLLELELTESVVMRDFVESSRQLRYLNQLGIRIAIDDFGTGYSSLSYLHQLPIDVLKIDRSFVEKIMDVEGTRPIVEAVISMAHTLGLQVIAEGVETSKQAVFLEEINCETMQGYFFSKALRAADTIPYLQHRRCEGSDSSSYAAATGAVERRSNVGAGVVRR
jgi:diguanylate cyclase (GGDEF)-like protein